MHFPLALTLTSHACRYLAANAANVGRMVRQNEDAVQFEDEAQVLVCKARIKNVFKTCLWMIKCMSVMLVGVGVKLALYAPILDTEVFIPNTSNKRITH